MIDITLRAMEPEDLDILYKIENDMALWHVSTTNVPYSRYVLHDFIANSSGDIYTDKQVRLMVENEEGKAIGTVDLVNFSAQHQRAELGLAILQTYRNRGYGKATLEKIIDYSWKILHLHQLYVVVDSSQTETIKLFLKCGFVQGAVLHGWLYTGEEYQNAVLLQYFKDK